MAGGLFARRDQKQFSVLNALHRRFGDASLRRISLVVGRIDQQQPSLDLLQIRRSVVVARRAPLPKKVVGIGCRRRGEACIDKLVRLGARRRLFLIVERATGGGECEGRGRPPRRARPARVVPAVLFWMLPATIE